MFCTGLLINKSLGLCPIVQGERAISGQDKRIFWDIVDMYEQRQSRSRQGWD